MKKNFWKGLTVCAFLCTMAFVPAWADVCFLPTGSCEQGARTRNIETKSCQDYIDSGQYYGEPQEGMDCQLSNEVTGCVLYSCSVMTCAARGYNIPNDQYIRSYTAANGWENCESCRQAGDTYWKCEARQCPEGLTTLANANCPDGQRWEIDLEAGYSGGKECGSCNLKQCAEGLVEEFPEDGCFTCTLAEDLGDGRSCYRCRAMAQEYITTAEKEELSETCFTFKQQSSASGDVCYKPTPLTCPLDQYVAHRPLENNKVFCSCQDYQYEFDATGSDVEIVKDRVVSGKNSHAVKLLHYTAAGGTKTADVTSTQTGEETVVWPYDAPSSAGECDVDKSSDGAKLSVTCPKNPSLDEKSYSFTIKQTQEDTVTTHTIEIRIIIDPDTCDNPQDTDSQCSAIGSALYSQGPRPACHKTHLENTCAQAGYVSVDSGRKSVAGQTCYYCINDNCDAGYDKGATPAPTEGYLEMTTDLGSNCFKVRPCDEDFSTAYQNIASCTQNGHTEGWNFTYNGMSADKVCGKCTAKTCTGEGKAVKCLPAPYCDEASANCGYKDWSVEYEGDTPKYNGNIKPCENGFSTAYQSVANCTRNGHPEGWNFAVSGASGDQVCGKCTPKSCTGQGKAVQCQPAPYCDENSASCGYKDWTPEYEGDTPKYNGNVKPCAVGSTDKASQCHTDSGYRSANNVCWAAPNTSCPANSSYDYGSCSCKCTLTCSGNTKLDASSCTCVSTGECSSDKDCGESSEFPLYCFNGKCRECGTYNDCINFRTDSSRFRSKYGNVSQITLRKGDRASLSELQSEYKSRCACTKYGECSQLNDDGSSCMNNERSASSEAQKTGWSGDSCSSDKDCFESSDFPLYCFNGKCRECGTFDDCVRFRTDGTRFRNKYGNVSSVNMSARDKNNSSVHIRYAGSKETLESLQQGYKERYYCTSHGECSQVNN